MANFYSDEYLDKVFDSYKHRLIEVVRKNNKYKKAYKLYQISKDEEKLTDHQYYLFSKAMSRKGYKYSSEYRGFIIEEIEFKEEKNKKTAKQMQEEFLAKKKATKLPDGGEKYSDIERKTKSHRDSFYKETEYQTIYHGLIFYDNENNHVEIIFKERKNVVSNGKTKHINYYNILDIDTGKKWKNIRRESSIKKLIEDKFLTINPKDESEMILIPDLDFYNDDNFE